MLYCVLTSCSARKELPKCSFYFLSSVCLQRYGSESCRGSLFILACYMKLPKRYSSANVFPSFSNNCLGQNNGASVS